MASEREQLTDEERESLVRARCDGSGVKALRIIDAHAADRAALVAQLEAALEETEQVAARYREERDAHDRLLEEAEDYSGKCEVLRAQVAELTRERDIARASLGHEKTRSERLVMERDEARADVRAAHQAHANAVNAKHAEVTRLTEALEAEKLAHALTQSSERGNAEALAAAEKTAGHVQIQHWRALVDQTEARAEAAEAQVAELTRERDEARANWERDATSMTESVSTLCAEVTRLTEALAAEEKAAATMVKGARETAEFHLRNSDAEYDRRVAAEQKLAAAERFSKDAAERHARDSSAYEARVRELEARPDPDGQRWLAAEADIAALRAEVVRLTQEKAAESAAKDAVSAALRAEVERESKLRAHWHGCFERTETELLRLREVARLESECETLRAYVAEANKAALYSAQREQAAESRLAAANALLGRAERYVPNGSLNDDLKAHLRAQPATAPARGDVLSDGTWIRTPEEERTATAPARPPFPPRGVQGRPELTEEYTDDATAPARDEADEECECPGAHECGVTTSTAANERKARTEAEQVREDIADYLAHVASVEVGSMLNDSGREIVNYCASWVRNRLDERWHAELARREPKRG